MEQGNALCSITGTLSYCVSSRVLNMRYILRTHRISAKLQWCHHERNGVSSHRCRYSLLNHLFRRRSKKTSKLRLTGLCEDNPPLTGGFPSQSVSNAENVSIWLRNHEDWHITGENDVTTTALAPYFPISSTAMVLTLLDKLAPIFDKKDVWQKVKCV